MNNKKIKQIVKEWNNREDTPKIKESWLKKMIKKNPDNLLINTLT